MRSKITKQFSSSLPNCSKCRWILWMILEIFKMWNQIIVEGCLTFPVNMWWFRVLVPCSATTKDCRLTHGIYLDYRETLLVFFFLHLIRPEILLKEFIIARHRDRQDQFHRRQGQGQGPLSPEMKNKTGAHCQCRHLQEGRRPWVH